MLLCPRSKFSLLQFAGYVNPVSSDRLIDHSWPINRLRSVRSIGQIAQKVLRVFNFTPQTTVIHLQSFFRAKPKIMWVRRFLPAPLIMAVNGALCWLFIRPPSKSRFCEREDFSYVSVGESLVRWKPWLFEFPIFRHLFLWGAKSQIPRQHHRFSELKVIALRIWSSRMFWRLGHLNHVQEE